MRSQLTFYPKRTSMLVLLGDLDASRDFEGNDARKRYRFSLRVNARSHRQLGAATRQHDRQRRNLRKIWRLTIARLGGSGSPAGQRTSGDITTTWYSPCTHPDYGHAASNVCSAGARDGNG